jgi:Tol biopolymer transport system component
VVLTRLCPFLAFLLPSIVAAQDYTIAYGSLGPLDTDIFIADGDGANAEAWLPHPALDYNASFSADGRWVVFTSERNGSADIYRARVDGSELTRLTADPAFDDQAAPAPDGRRLAFVSSRTGNAEVFILDLETNDLTNLTQHPGGDFRPAWSPDSEWLAFSSDRNSTMPRVNFGIGQTTDLYVVRRDGTSLRRMTDAEGIVGTPAWSHDGKSILHYAAPPSELVALITPGPPGSPGGTTQIVALDLETRSRRTLTDGAGTKLFPRWIDDGAVAFFERRGAGRLRFGDGRPEISGEYQHPVWSADWTRLLYHREVSAGWPPFRPGGSRASGFELIRTGLFPSYAPNGDRFVMNSGRMGIAHNSILIADADGSNGRLLFDDPERSALAPSWSPRGDRIAFGLGTFFTMVRGPAVADIALLDVVSHELTVLTDGDANLGFPSFSPDGERLVYRGWDASGSTLILRDLRTGEETTLLRGFGRVNFPSWSPVGELVQFTSDRGGDQNYDVYTIDVTTQRTMRLTSHPGVDGHASWSPDGRWLAFSSTRQGFKDEAVLHPGNPQSSGEIYVMRGDGSDVRLVTDNQFEDATTAWAPQR